MDSNYRYQNPGLIRVLPTSTGQASTTTNDSKVTNISSFTNKFVKKAKKI